EAFWQAVSSEKTTGIDFRLTPRPPRKEFNFIQFSDQENQGSSLAFYHAVGERAVAEDSAFVISTGDLCYANGIKMTAKEMKPESFGGIRTYITLGNHDLVGEHGSGDVLYESLCGPTRYAFEEGNVLFIVLPMCYGDRRPTYTYQEIIAFTKSLLETWPKGAPVFFFNHFWRPFFDTTSNFGNVYAEKFDLSPWKVIGLAYGHTHWYEASVDLPIPMWSTGQSKSGGAGNMPGAIRIFRIDKEANCTTELVESGVIQPRITALLDAKGNLTATAFGSTCKVDAVSAVIGGKTSKLNRRTSWLWTLDGKCATAPDKVNMDYRAANRPGVMSADIRTNGDGLFRLEDTLCLPQKTLFGKPVITNGLAIIGLEDENNSQEGGVCAVDIAKGTIAWRYKTGFSVRNSLLLDGQSVYAVDVRNRIFKLNAADGKEVWKNSPDKLFIDDNCHSAPCVGGKYVYGGCGTSLRAVDRETGKTIWTAKDARESFGSTMGPVYHNGKLFLTVNWGYLQAFDAATGKLLWNSKEKEPKQGFLFQPTLTVLPDGMLLRCDGKYGAVVFNPENGDCLRFMETPVSMSVSSVPLVVGDMAFCGASMVGCCAFDLKTLKPLWNMKDTIRKSILSTIQYRGPQNLMEASPVMADGKLICAGADGVLYAVSPADGKVLAIFDVGSPLLGTPAFADGRLYVPDYSGRILVFSLTL
ncbi:MAG: PQQ-binding-like beta-propeller repeat protein, partial [Victivallales bacterium]|nr:PQQ-binding-like beta-propeller repeat protein [Victivallales bacterium]